MTKAKLQSLMKKDWVEALYPYFQTESFKQLNERIVKDRRIRPVYPAKENIFRVFNETALKDIKVLIIGQDPYHNAYPDGTPAALGRAFACDRQYGMQPSLRNIIKELEDDIGLAPAFDHTLQHWVDQGVFLLNTALTVREKDPGSHAGHWKEFTNTVLKTINTRCSNIVVILWGNHAKSYKTLLDNSSFHIIEFAHPNPFSCKNFFGSKPFSKANKYLLEVDKMPINWHEINSLLGKMKPYSDFKHYQVAKFIPQEEIVIKPPKNE